MKYLFTILLLASGITLMIQPAFSQKKQTVTPMLLAPPPTDPGDGGGGGGGGYTPPPVYGRFVANGSDHTGNAIILWEGNNCTQDEVLRHPLTSDTEPISKKYKDLHSSDFFVTVAIEILFSVGPNDEARSMSMQGIKAGRMIEFYDSPDGSKSDDWVEIYIKQDIHSFDLYQVYTFEHSYEDAYVRVTNHHHNGLDGKVSYINTYMAN